MVDLTEFAKCELASLREKNLLRSLKTVENDQGPEILHQGKTYLNFSSNNYLGLAGHPELIKASVAATQKYGVGSGASRLITGSMQLHAELEQAIARFKGTEAALVFNSGYHANMGVIPALVGTHDLVCSDELNHASLIDGMKLTRAQVKVYKHGDMGQLVQALGQGKQSKGCSRLIVTDSVFSMDGDLAPLKQIMELAEQYDAWVFVDEAHATGVFGKKGRGLVEHFGIPSNHPRLIQMGTLGKALGSFGAYVCGSKELIEFLINRARTFIYTTALPPGVLAASIAALALMQKDQSLKDQLWKNITHFGSKLQNISDRRGSIHRTQHAAQSPIFPLIIGDAAKTMEISQKLFASGIWAQGIRPPTVPAGTARLRLTLMATHSQEQLDRCLDVLGSLIF